MGKLSIRQLYKSYGAFTAVDHIDLDIEDGEMLVLLGPSGCGKTTTLRCVAGLEEVTDGTISIGDKLVSSKTVAIPPEKREIGMVFQSYAIWPHMTVAENIAFGPKIKRAPSAEIASRVKDAMDIVGLTDFADRPASKLSGGQQQRVALARAMALRPRVLLFDEPLSNLDAKLREKMRFEIRQIQQRLGITAIYVTHDQQEAMVIADRVVLMRGGKIEQIAPPRELYSRPVSRFAAQFIGLMNLFDAQAQGDEVRLADGVVLKVPGSAGRRGAVEAIIRPEDVRISGQPIEGANVFRAEVTEHYYLGNLSDLTVRVGGVEVRAQLSPPKDHPVGSQVWVQLPPEALVILPATGAPAELIDA